MCPINAAGSPSAPGVVRPSGTLKLKSATPATEEQVAEPPRQTDRAAFYIDGFNLYHALNEYRVDKYPSTSFLKWLDLKALSGALAVKGREGVVKVVWCSAEYPYDNTKIKLHRAYRDALLAVGVDVQLGHFVQEPFDCRATCGEQFKKPTEKAGDVNVGIHLIADAYADVFDVAYLITADSDQVATLKMMSERFPRKRTVVVAPLGREHSQLLLQYATRNVSITLNAVEHCLFPMNVMRKDQPAVQRPAQYSPPNGWQRPPLDAASPSAGQPPQKSIPPPIRRMSRQPKSFEVAVKPAKKIPKS